MPWNRAFQSDPKLFSAGCRSNCLKRERTKILGSLPWNFLKSGWSGSGSFGGRPQFFQFLAAEGMAQLTAPGKISPGLFGLL